MKSLVQELQQTSHDKKTSLQEVVRQALFIAKKMRLTNFQKQMEAELNGYSKDVNVPSYRLIRTNLKGWDHVLKEWQPVNFDNMAQYANLTTFHLIQPIGDLENLILDTSSQEPLYIPLSKEQERQIIQELEYPPMPPSEITRFLDRAHVRGIVL